MAKRPWGHATTIYNIPDPLWKALRERANRDRRTMRQTVMLALTLFCFGRDEPDKPESRTLRLHEKRMREEKET